MGAGAVGAVTGAFLVAAGAVGCSATASVPPPRAPAAPAHGTVTGRLVIEGGPIGPGGKQPGPRPVPGTVRFTGGPRLRRSIATDIAGRFAASLPPGRYLVADRSPAVMEADQDGSRHQTWSEPIPVEVTARHTTTVTLVIAVP